MIFLIAIFSIAESFLISIPESAGLLIFGVGLVLLAISVRAILGRSDRPKEEDNGAEKAKV